MPTPTLTSNAPILEGNVSALLERLCELFLETNLPVAKARLMPYVHKEIMDLERNGQLDVSPSLKLVGGIVWDCLRQYMQGVRV